MSLLCVVMRLVAISGAESPFKALVMMVGLTNSTKVKGNQWCLLPFQNGEPGRLNTELAVQ